MPDRRSILRAVAALPALATAPAAATPATPLDPIIALHIEWLVARDRYDATDFTQAPEGHDAAVFAPITHAEERATTTRATSVAGAIRAIEWAEAEFREHKDDGCLGDKLILALLASALGVLRTLELRGA